MKQYTANANDEDVRISRFVQRVAPSLPVSTMYKAFRNKRVKVNGRRVEADYRLHPGDLVELYINDHFFSSPASTDMLPAEKVPFDVVWQDESLAVLYKPAGVLSHSDSAGHATLLDGFDALLRETGEYVPQAANGFAPALCNRLDRNTEGLVLGAKTYPALRDANALIAGGLLHKAYLCVAVGTPPPGRLEAWLARDFDTKKVTVTPGQAPGSKPIITDVKILEEKNGLSLCEIGLVTGRTHQIRAHLAFLGHPVLGDSKYGNRAENRWYGLNAQALCAFQLAFDKTLPEENTLAHMAGRHFDCRPQATLMELWNKI